MKRPLGVLLALSMTLSLMVCAGTSALAAGDDEVIVSGSGTFTVEEAVERVLAYEECQALAGKHEFYHTAGQHEAELENIWVYDEDYQKTASWTNNTQYMDGWDNLWAFYVDNLEADLNGFLRNAIAMDDTGVITDTDDWLGTGTFPYHMLMTPVIEVAGDGQTACGLWQSFGTSNAPQASGYDSVWQCEDYTMVFAKQSNGDWRIWHLRTFVHFYTSVDDHWYEFNQVLDNGGGSAAPDGAALVASGDKTGAMPSGGKAEGTPSGNTVPNFDCAVVGDYYQGYDLYCVPQQMSIPKPYETWDDIADTFYWGPQTVDNNKIQEEFATYQDYDFSAYKTN